MTTPTSANLPKNSDRTRPMSNAFGLNLGQTTPVVDRWTGRTACLLQLAAGMTVERFANRLGVAPRTVAYWRSRPGVSLSAASQEVLSAAFDQASPAVQTRFERLVAAEPRISRLTVNGEPLLVLMPAPIELTTDRLATYISELQHELRRMRANHDRLREAVTG